MKTAAPVPVRRHLHRSKRAASLRLAISATIVTTLVGAGLTASASPADAGGQWLQHVAGTGGDGLWVHSQAGLSQDTVTTLLPEAAEIVTDCLIYADVVGGTDSAWLHLTSPVEGWVSDYYVDTSWSRDNTLVQQGLPECGTASSDTNDPAGNTPLGNEAPYSCAGPNAHSDTYDGFAACEWAVHNAQAASRFPTNDCTWFVSQTLWEGGLDQTDTWTGASYDASKLATNNPKAHGFGYRGPTTATTANTLVEYLVANSLATRTRIDWSDNTAAGAQIGDIIAYHWNHVGPGADPNVDYVDHLSIVTGFEGIYPLVSQHTSQQLNRGWSWSNNDNDWIELAMRNDDKSVVPTAWLIHIN